MENLETRKTFEGLIFQSECFLKTEPRWEGDIRKWINRGDEANVYVYEGRQHKRTLEKSLEAAKTMVDLLDKSNLVLQDDLILYRGTDYPCTTIPVLTSVTISKDEANNFGPVYPIHVPSGTRLFYVSAVEWTKREFTEQEFILSPGTTTLNGNELVYHPCQFDLVKLQAIYD